MQIINVTNCGDVHDNFDRFISGEAKGKVQLAVPVANILQWKPVEGELYLLTNILPEELEKVIKYAGYVVLDPKNTGIKKNTVITEEEYAALANRYGAGSFRAGYGAETIYDVLAGLDTRELFEKYREEERGLMQTMEELLEDRRKGQEETESEEEYENKYGDTEGEIRMTEEMLETTRAQIDAVLYIRKHVDRFLIREISFFPIDARAVLKDKDKEYPYGIFHDIRDFVCNIACQSRKVKELQELNAPEIIMRSEKRKLQEYVDAYLANGLLCDSYTKGYESEDVCIPLASLAGIILRNTELI